jgi:hypothetical protein
MMNNELDLAVRSCSLTEVLSRYLPEGTEENHEITSVRIAGDSA